MRTAAADTFETPARALPKVLLHEHLDGGLRLDTLLQLLQERGLPSPAADLPSLGRWFDGNAHAGSLEKYLEGFALTVAAMATPAALQRVAREAAADAFAQGVVLAEFRIAPLLFEAHGVSGEAAVEALLSGLAQAPMPCGLIVCAMRHLPPEQTLRAAKLALRYRSSGKGRAGLEVGGGVAGEGAAGGEGYGVIGFDLAGPEKGFPPSMHGAALALVRDAGLPITLHAGEADAAERVLEAGRLGAARIGHGVRLVDALQRPDGVALLAEAQALGLHLEVCPTSNVHTGAADSIASHPITALWRAGVSLSYHTDNTLISRITPSGEAAALLRHTTLTAADLLAMARLAAQASFMPEAQRLAALRSIDAHAVGAAAPG